MFFNGWEALLRNSVFGMLSYVGLILLLRVSGKRTLSKMNAFDLVVTVALGSTLATILLSKDVSLAEGFTALGVLVGLQYLVAWLSVRSRWFKTITHSEPCLLAYRGEVLQSALREERVTTEELLAAVRNEGLSDLREAEAVVLETDGTFSVTREFRA
jgi:uncharacterized membrane protein YcaP (DUF421 family)